MASSLTHRGPLAYLNWWSLQYGVEELKDTIEFQFFSDSKFRGDKCNFGPYTLFNSLLRPFELEDSDVIAPRLVLRLDWHLPYQIDMPRGEDSDFTRYHGGWIDDEVAALFSLLWGVRIKSVGVVRHFLPNEDAKGRPESSQKWEQYLTMFRQIGSTKILPRTIRECNITKSKELERLDALYKLGKDEATALVIAARVYQEAIWIAEIQPELAWLLLVSAIERAANFWKTDDDIRSTEAFEEFEPELSKELKEKYCEDAFKLVANKFGGTMKASRKFVDFMMEFLPEPPSGRPLYYQIIWNKTSDKTRALISKVYDLRSKALHMGIPMPAPMCSPPRKFPVDSNAKSSVDTTWAETPDYKVYTKGGYWAKKDLPMLLHTFEFMVRHCLLNWWDTIFSKSKANNTQGN